MIMLAIVGGAYYILNLRIDEMVLLQEQQATVMALDTQSESTEPEAIESDLESESPDEFDQELDQAFAELEASFSAQ